MFVSIIAMIVAFLLCKYIYSADAWYDILFAILVITWICSVGLTLWNITLLFDKLLTKHWIIASLICSSIAVMIIAIYYDRLISAAYHCVYIAEDSITLVTGSKKKITIQSDPEDQIDDVWWTSDDYDLAQHLDLNLSTGEIIAYEYLTTLYDYSTGEIIKDTIQRRTTTIRIYNEAGNRSDEIQVNIVDLNGHEAVDLGLPSGTLWATCNVGAIDPEDFGNYYAWGETRTKSQYDWKSYVWGNPKSGKKGIIKYNSQDNGTLDIEDDAAHVKWEGDWRIPTNDNWIELANSCTWVWTRMNNINGYKVIGANDNYIFLPAAGQIYEYGYWKVKEAGFYWSSSVFLDDFSDALIIGFSPEDSWAWGRTPRYEGCSIRPVITGTL